MATRSDQKDEPTLSLGDRLRARRLETGLTLKLVADGAGLSTGFISQVERDLVAPSLSSLAGIAAVLDVPVSELLPGFRPAGAETRADARPIYNVGVRARMGYERISTTFPGSMLSSVIIHEPPGHRSEPIRHEGEEMFFILDGTITVEVDGRRTILNRGDSLHFSSRQRHSTWNHGTGPAAILHVCTMDVFGDRIAAGDEGPGLHAGHDTPRAALTPEPGDTE